MRTYLLRKLHGVPAEAYNLLAEEHEDLRARAEAFGAFDVPAPDLLTPDEREADEQAANGRVAAEVADYSDTLPSMR